MINRIKQGILRRLRYYVIYPLGYVRFVYKKHFKIKSAEETIAFIQKHQVSVSRFGDGEFRVMNGSGNGFQNPDARLAARLREVLASELPNHIVCLPYSMQSTSWQTKDSAAFWKRFIAENKQCLNRITPPHV